jgi:hypothetical protein
MRLYRGTVKLSTPLFMPNSNARKRVGVKAVSWLTWVVAVAAIVVLLLGKRLLKELNSSSPWCSGSPT